MAARIQENFVDDEIPLQGGSHASSSHEASLEPTTKRREDLGKHSVKTHFPKDRNCELCKRTKIIRAPCRRRNGKAVPRADKFGDLITGDHKVLSDNCESRNNHRYAVVVQDLATQWIQAYPCKTKTSQETQRSLQKFLEPERKPKVIYTDNSLEFGKACEDLSWNHCTSTPHRSETNGIAERAVRRVKEGTSAVLLQSGLNESWWQILWNVTPICETSQIYYFGFSSGEHTDATRLTHSTDTRSRKRLAGVRKDRISDGCDPTARLAREISSGTDGHGLRGNFVMGAFVCIRAQQCGSTSLLPRAWTTSFGHPSHVQSTSRMKSRTSSSSGLGSLDESANRDDEKAQFMRVTGSHVDREELSSRHFIQRQQVAERTPFLCATA